MDLLAGIANWPTPEQFCKLLRRHRLSHLQRNIRKLNISQDWKNVLEDRNYLSNKCFFVLSCSLQIFQASSVFNLFRNKNISQSNDINQVTLNKNSFCAHLVGNFKSLSRNGNELQLSFAVAKCISSASFTRMKETSSQNQRIMITHPSFLNTFPYPNCLTG